MRRLRLQNAPFCKGFVKDLKHLERIWRIGHLSHKVPEGPKCFALWRKCIWFGEVETTRDLISSQNRSSGIDCLVMQKWKKATRRQWLAKKMLSHCYTKSHFDDQRSKIETKSKKWDFMAVMRRILIKKSSALKWVRCLTLLWKNH